MTPVEPLPRERYLGSIATDGAEIGRWCRQHPDRTVPTCPDWTGADLLAHLCGFAIWVGDLHAGRVGPVDPAPVVDAGTAVRDWDSHLDDLLTLLRGTHPATPVPNWSVAADDGTFWARRAAQDIAVHRHDAARLGTGRPDPVPDDIALDGVHEYLDVFVATAFAGGLVPESEATLELTATGPVHTVRRDLPHPGPVTTLRGTASDLLLALWHRREPLELFVSGDRALIETWPHI
ncbi:maleylpyruvate isomerase family mycothiol-dependent enzyme [Pseudonocardia sp. KRD291]|uniref:maleylpyruvate isomerase family mycothiol-dependent enzyme n=1 Tax=Pseudonocardia sp. KRD291 TaxID=2792007 RepID=UPI001C4A755E|nr:maleylpyruvate isomerase family mycothiol-dependent enzyme [Pseudonocardia sp. KRD291]MBW0103267.1 maleylpyruvate isomerase family mycothiol-dependent enzyme [Pseudonocardia sp. KRD291]